VSKCLLLRYLLTNLISSTVQQQQSPSRPTLSPLPVLTEVPLPPPIPATTSDAVFTSVTNEMAAAAKRLRGSPSIDNRMSVKTLIESIENATKHHKAGADTGNTLLSTACTYACALGFSLQYFYLKIIIFNSNIIFFYLMKC
jgi:hypothetical protein